MWILIAILAAGVAGASMLDRARHAARYPGAVPISSHYSQHLPYAFRWDNSYHSEDPFPDIFNWYSTTYGLGSEHRANGSCLLLQGSQPQLSGQRLMSVFLCDTPTGRMIYVTRATSFR